MYLDKLLAQYVALKSMFLLNTSHVKIVITKHMSLSKKMCERILKKKRTYWIIILKKISCEDVELGEAFMSSLPSNSQTKFYFLFWQFLMIFVEFISEFVNSSKFSFQPVVILFQDMMITSAFSDYSLPLFQNNQLFLGNLDTSFWMIQA